MAPSEQWSSGFRTSAIDVCVSSPGICEFVRLYSKGVIYVAGGIRLLLITELQVGILSWIIQKSPV